MARDFENLPPDTKEEPVRAGRFGSAQARFLALFVPITVVVVCASVVFSEYISLRSSREHLRTELEAVVASSARPLADALWHYDLEILKKFVEALAVQSSITQVIVTDEAGALIVSAGRAVADQGPLSILTELSIVVGGRTVGVGTLRIDGTDEALRQQFRDRLWIAGFMGIFIIAVSIVASLLANWRAIGRPMSLLLSGIAAFEKDLKPRPIVWQRDDEFAKLVAAFNRFQIAASEHDRQQLADRAELEAEIERRTLALRKALAEAQSADRAKTTFLGTMSHELRTPLNAIIGFSEAISTELFGPLSNVRYREYANNIHRSGQMLLTLIEQILELSKLEALEFTPPLTTVNAAQVINDSLTLLQRESGLADVAITADIPDDVPTFVGDPRTLVQLLINLIGNAIKFSQPGQSVAVTCRVVPPHVVFEVIDSGVGIASEELETVMEPFTQAGDVLTRKHGGVGLGLFISKKIVMQHRGAIQISSTLGSGTRVRVTLPLTPDVAGGAVDDERAAS